MTESQQQLQTELLTRLDLMEAVVREGRRINEYWGWAHLLWGAAYLIAIGWFTWGPYPGFAWPVTMVAAAVITIAVSISKKRAHPQTTVGRSLGAIWAAVGTAIFLYCFSAAISGHNEPHAFLATVEVLLGVANFASAAVLRWRVQFLVALVWWVSAVTTCFVAAAMIVPVLVAATLIGMIGFGLYLMYCERRDRRSHQSAVQHG